MVIWVLRFLRAQTDQTALLSSETINHAYFQSVTELRRFDFRFPEGKLTNQHKDFQMRFYTVMHSTSRGREIDQICVYRMVPIHSKVTGKTMRFPRIKFLVFKIATILHHGLGSEFQPSPHKIERSDTKNRSEQKSHSFSSHLQMFPDRLLYNLEV